MEVAECGVACLAMVLGAFGRTTSLEELRDICGTSRDGNTALQLLRGARRLALSGRGLAVPFERLADLKTPAVLHWQGNHFVVLERVRRGRVSIVNPAVGRQRLNLAEVREAFSGTALELEPGAGFKKQRARSPSIGRYVELLKRHRGATAFVLCAIITQQLLAALFPAVTQVLIDHVIQPRRERWVPAVLAIMAFSMLAQIGLQHLRGTGQARLHAALGKLATLELGRRLLSLPLPFLEGRSHGDVLERVHKQAEVQTLVVRMSQAFFDLGFVSLLVALLLSYDLQLGLLCFGLLLLRLGVIHAVRRLLKERASAELAAAGREQAALAEALIAPEMTVGLELESALTKRYRERTDTRIGCRVQAGLLEQGLARGLSAFSTAMHAGVLWLGGRLVMAGEMTVGVFAAFLAVQQMLELPLASLLNVHEAWVKARGILERSDDLLAVAPVREGARWASGGLRGVIEARGVSFRYSANAPWLLRDVNLRIEPGEHVALIGPSGSGKSTLARLLVGLLEPTCGQVLLDGVDLREIDRGWLARELGVVLQQPVIFGGALSRILRLRLPEASDDAVVRAAGVAELNQLIRRLPGGLEAMIESDGRNISGGERQRVAIAQAVLGHPKMLLLDEGTCALDRDTEARVLANISALGASVVSVAHRVSALEFADRVVALHDATASDVTPSRTARAARPSTASGTTTTLEQQSP